MIQLDGVLGPVVTPFDARGEIDADAFSRNLRAHIGAGVLGVVVTGSTGEAALLDEAERLQLVELARAECDSDHPLIVGIGGESTRITIRRAHEAVARGADALLVVAPHYYGDAMTHAALRDHYARVADASKVPVLLYTIPKYMHFALSPALVLELAHHQNIVGMKDSSGDAALFQQYLAARGSGFRVLTGSASLLADALRMGADGAILAASLFAPSLCLDVFDAARQGNHDMAAAAQRRLTPIGARIVGAMGVAGVKSAMDAVGLAGGVPRLPLQPLDAAAQAELRTLLQSAELVPPA